MGSRVIASTIILGLTETFVEAAEPLVPMDSESKLLPTDSFKMPLPLRSIIESSACEADCFSSSGSSAVF